MKTLFTKNLVVIITIFFTTAANAQNIFPSTGRAGIYTTSPASSLQVKGGARIGTAANYLNVDSATGNLSFVGTSAYQVAGNKYAFQYTGNPNYGLFFNSSAVQYEFRNGSASPVFSINANTGNGVLNGTLKIGAYTLPSTDGANGRVLKTNGSGAVSWGIDSNTTYSAGAGLSLSGTTFTNTAPDKTVTLMGSGATTVSGTYPSFTISSPSYNYDILTYPYNTGVGNSALHSLNPNGSVINNTGVGIFSLTADTSGYNNTGTGAYALFSNTTGYDNTATGKDAMNGTISGHDNTADGVGALLQNYGGNYNTAVGAGSAASMGYSTYNTAVGDDALSYVTGNSNSANGAYSLYGFNNGSGSTGSDNTASGYESLYAISSGNYNTANGVVSLYNNTTGFYNTAAGMYSLYDNTTGAYNTGIGLLADVNSGGYNYSTAVGVGATITASNQIRIGSIGSTSGYDPVSIGGVVGWSTLSDGRVKKNIKENVPGLAFINKLKPITYNIDNDAINKIVQRPAIKDKDGKTTQPSADEIATRKTEEQIVHTGFIAQDVEKAAKSLNYDFSGVDAAKNSKDLYGLRYAEFVVPLVKAVQELSAQNDSLQNQINELKAMITPNQSTISNQSAVVLTDASSLQQNVPNPFTNTTSIGYSLPQKFNKAQILITDKNCATLKAINISGSGKGNLTVNASTLASGAYQYSLIVDGRLIDTKQMVLAK